ncbi:MAG: Gfo/Idh/MocA family oxidoreductase [Deinococcales bacterium]
MTLPVRVGIVGGGRWAAMHRAALEAAGAPLAGVLVRTEESARRLREGWHVPVTIDLQAFLDLDLDAVVVASPNHLHADHAVAALEAGKHVLVEKPMATTVEDCDRILDAAERAQRVLAVGHEMRVFRLFEGVRQEAARLGRVQHLDLRLFRRPYRSGASGWKQDPAKLGSSILEEPIHYLDLARWYLGEVEAVQAWATSRPGREGLYENLDVRLAFEGGAQAMVTRTIAGFEHHVRCDLNAERGAVRARWDGRQDTDEDPAVLLAVQDEDGIRSVPVPQRTGHAIDLPRQTEAFLRAVTEGTAVPADGRDGRVAVALCLAVERSLQEGSRPVLLPG